MHRRLRARTGGSCGSNRGSHLPRLCRRELEAVEIREVECSVVGHDRHHLAFEQLVGRRRRRRIAEQVEIELVATDMDVPGQDGPACFAQPSSDQILGGVTRQLSGRSTGSGASTVQAADDPT